MIDLSFTCWTSDKSFVTREFDTIMDFTDAFENNELTPVVLNCTDIDATFFENPHNQKHFNCLKDLYEHCVYIMK